MRHLKVVGDKYYIDWNKIEDTVRIGVRFLDNVLDVSYYPIDKIRIKVQQLRRIGLGVIGLADILLKMGIPYGSCQSIKFVDELFQYIRGVADEYTMELSEEKGCYPMLKELIKEGALPKDTKRRNITTMASAPTGSTTMLAGCEGYSILPLFAQAYTKSMPNINDVNGNGSNKYVWINPELSELSDKDREIIVRTGMVKDTSLSDSDKKLFATAMEIPPYKILKVLATIQKWIDNSISYTINLPNDATVDNVKSIYRLSYALGLKSATVYRDGSLESQIIEFGIKDDEPKYCRLDGSCDE